MAQNRSTYGHFLRKKLTSDLTLILVWACRSMTNFSPKNTPRRSWEFLFSWMVNCFHTDLKHDMRWDVKRKEKGESRQTDIESLIQNKASKLPRPLLLYWIPACFSRLHPMFTTDSIWSLGPSPNKYFHCFFIDDWVLFKYSYFFWNQTQPHVFWSILTPTAFHPQLLLPI